jgi:hypothetical protein
VSTKQSDVEPVPETDEIGKELTEALAKAEKWNADLLAALQRLEKIREKK